MTEYRMEAYADNEQIYEFIFRDGEEEPFMEWVHDDAVEAAQDFAAIFYGTYDPTESESQGDAVADYDALPRWPQFDTARCEYYHVLRMNGEEIDPEHYEERMAREFAAALNE
jgi:hypothetical protein